METFHILAGLVSLAALGSYLNYRFSGMPTSIALMATALAFSVALALLNAANVIDLASLKQLVASIDFSGLLLHGMLAFLLFAGALHVDLAQLRTQAVSIALLATLGTAFSSGITGIGFWWVSNALGFHVPLVHALLFGAVVSSTDPIAVLGILRQAGVPKNIEIKITCESLFNDGVAIVVFVTLLNLATGRASPHAGEIALFLAREILGAIALGTAAGYVGHRLLRTVDHYPVEVLITLAVAVGTYSCGDIAHVSSPISVVVAGLIIGNHGRTFAMSERTREHVDSFWELIDYIMNALLFLLIGAEVLTLDLDVLLRPSLIGLSVCTIGITLISRLIGVSLPIGLLSPYRSFDKGTIRILTWGGLKGGISIALALSLPDSVQRDVIVPAAYVVVLFSLLVQGLTLRAFISRFGGTA